MSRTVYWVVVEHQTKHIPNLDSTIPEIWEIHTEKQFEIFSKATGYTSNGVKDLVHEDLIEFMQQRMVENKFLGFEVLRNVSVRR